MGRRHPKLRAYASHVSKLWPYEWSANKIHASLCNTRSPQSSRKINLNRGCTESDSQCCHILDDLTLWNEFLCLWHMELKEAVPGELSVNVLHGGRLDFALETQSSYALVLLHWLLKEHHCVKSLKVQSSIVQRYLKLLFDAVHLNVGLRSLELQGCHKSGRDFFDQSDKGSHHLVTTLGTLVRLEEFRLSDIILSQDAVALLGAAFENISLKSFAYVRSHNFAEFYTAMPPDSAVLLIESFKRSKTLRELAIDHCCLHGRPGAMFAEYLEGNNTLEKLTIHIVSMTGHWLEELAPVLGALARNKVVLKFQLVGYPVYEFKRDQLSGAVTTNKALRSSRVLNNSQKWEGATVPDVIKNNATLLELDASSATIEDVKPFAEAVRVNKTMRQLSLSWLGLSLCDTKEFCSALAENQSLEVVTMNNIDEELVEGVYRVLRETGTEQRVRLASIIKSALVLQRTLENCSDLRDVCYCAAFRDTTSNDGESLADRDDDDPEDGDDSATDDDSECGNTDHDGDDHGKNAGDIPKGDRREAAGKSKNGDIPKDDHGDASGGTSSDDDDGFGFNYNGYGYYDDDDMLNYYYGGEDYENYGLYDDLYDYDSDGDSYYDYGDDDSDIDYFYDIEDMDNVRDDEEVAPEIPAFRCLSLSSHLETLLIVVNERMHEERAGLLAQFLSSTKTLKSATFSFPTTEPSTQSLLDGLSSNTSISTLELGLWRFKKRHAEDFAQLLRKNETLNHLALHDVKTKLILQELSSYIADNKFLVSIDVDDMGSLTQKLWMFQIMDVLRRNSSLLQCAVHFVMGNRGKRFGEAFEQMFRSKALLEKVQELTSETESAALERIRSSKRYLDVNFLAVAGVVKDMVACNRGDGRRTRLDQIGEDNWLRVRSYLKLTDIKEKPEPQCSQGPKRKRRGHARRRRL
ncbi:unnamed protein product [Ixodes hexagonus]